MECEQLITEYNNLCYWDKDKFCEGLYLTNAEQLDGNNMSDEEVMDEVRIRNCERKFIRESSDKDIIYAFFWCKSYLDESFAEVDNEKLINVKNEIERILTEKSNK